MESSTIGGGSSLSGSTQTSNASSSSLSGSILRTVNEFLSTLYMSGKLRMNGLTRQYTTSLSSLNIMGASGAAGFYENVNRKPSWNVRLCRGLMIVWFLYILWIGVWLPGLTSHQDYSQRYLSSSQSGKGNETSEFITSPFGYEGGWIFRVLNYPLTLSTDAIPYEGIIALSVIFTLISLVNIVLMVIVMKKRYGNMYKFLDRLAMCWGLAVLFIGPVALFIMSSFVDCNPNIQIEIENQTVSVSGLSRFPLIQCYSADNIVLIVLSLIGMVVTLVSWSFSVFLLPINTPNVGIPFVTKDNFILAPTICSIGLQLLIMFLIPPNYFFGRAIVHIILTLINIPLVLYSLPFYHRMINSLYFGVACARFGTSIGVLIAALVNLHLVSDLGLGMMGLSVGFAILFFILGFAGLEIYTRIICRQIRNVFKTKISVCEITESRADLSIYNIIEREAVSIFIVCEQLSLRHLMLFLQFSIGQNVKHHSAEHYSMTSVSDPLMSIAFVKSISQQKSFLNSEMLLISSVLVNYIWQDDHRSQFANYLLAKALKHCHQTFKRVLIIEKQKEIEITINELTKTNMEVRNTITELEHTLAELSIVHKSFWKEMLNDIPNETKLSQINSRASVLTLFCDQNFLNLIKAHSHDKTVIRFYASYLEEFKFDKELSNSLFEEAAAMEEEESRSKNVNHHNPQSFYEAKKFKNKVVPSANVEISTNEDISIERDESGSALNGKSQYNNEMDFEGVENQGIDKKETFFRTAINTPFQSKLRVSVFLFLSVLIHVLLIVIFILSIIYNERVVSTPLVLQSCITGSTPGALLRVARMNQILTEVFTNEGQTWLKNSTRNYEVNHFQETFTSRYLEHKGYLEQLISNSQSGKFTSHMYKDFTDRSSPILIPIPTTDPKSVEFVNTFSKNVSMSEVSQEFLHHVEQFLDFTEKQYNETTKSYNFMYIYLNRRYLADNYLQFCKSFQESERANTSELNIILLAYIFTSSSLMTIVYFIFIMISRAEMTWFTKITNLYKKIPKDFVGIIYHRLEEKTKDDAKHLKKNPLLLPRTFSLILTILIVTVFMLSSGLIYYEISMNISTASSAIYNVDLLSVFLRTVHRVTIRMNELFIYLTLPTGKFINSPYLVSNNSQLQTMKTEIRQFIDLSATIYDQVIYGQDGITSPLVGKYPKLDKMITGLSSCTNSTIDYDWSKNGNKIIGQSNQLLKDCYGLQKYMSTFTILAGQVSEKFFNPAYASKQPEEAFTEMLTLFNMCDMVYDKFRDFLTTLVSLTSVPSITISIIFLIFGVTSMLILQYMIFISFQTYDHEITNMKGFLNYLSTEYIESNDGLKNFALYNSIGTNYLTGRKVKQSSAAADQDSLKKLMSSMVDGALLANEHGDIILFNGPAQNMFGKSISDVLGTNFMHLFDEHSAEKLTNILVTIKGEIDDENVKHGDVIELECVRKNSTKFPAMVTIFVSRISGGSDKGKNNSMVVSCFMRDITPEKKQNSLLAEEKKNSENLLRNILPDAVASKLKSGETFIAERFSDITCFFSDMVGFTKMSSGMNPSELVLMLSTIVNGFDDLTDVYSLEKIKTIGDAYFCVGGLHNNPQSDHPERTLRFAIDTFQVIRNYNIEHPQTQLNIRVGINTGSVVAGVIGKKKFAYDLWGDTINTASRMESTSIAGRIQISRSTYQRVYDIGFEFEQKSVEVKGKGLCETYLLKDKHHAQTVLTEEEILQIQQHQQQERRPSIHPSTVSQHISDEQTTPTPHSNQ